MTVGLTLGKYAPFHAGHQLVIETALKEMDKVIVIIYDEPLYTKVPLTVRATWIKRLYPVEIIEAWEDHPDNGYDPDTMRAHEEYIKRLVKDKGVTHFYSSENYGEHISKALGASDRRVDQDRKIYPTSGTELRKDAFFYKDFIHPLVYRDLIMNVVLLGAPSTGKTTLAKRLALEFRTVWMPEYGREYWETHQIDKRLTSAQLLEIAEGHLDREEALLQQANRFLFTDTNALTTRLFSKYYHGRSLSKLDTLADKCQQRYDLVLVCDTDIPYDDTWDRSGDANRRVFQKWILADLAVRKIPYVIISGTIDERVSKVCDILLCFNKYGNQAGLSV